MPLMPVNFRLATITHLPTILELVKEFHELEHLSFDKQIDSIALEKILIDGSLGQVWLIDKDNKVIGYVILTLGYSLEYHGRDAFIDELYIRDNYRRQGIGTKTLEFVEDACQSLGVQALHLEVDFENVKAQKLYRKVGYKDHDRYLMTKWFER